MKIEITTYDFNAHPGRESTSASLIGDPERRKLVKGDPMKGFAPNIMAAVITEPHQSKATTRGQQP